jgi:hypothetical protein
MRAVKAKRGRRGEPEEVIPPSLASEIRTALLTDLASLSVPYELTDVVEADRESGWVDHVFQVRAELSFDDLDRLSTQLHKSLDRVLEGQEDSAQRFRGVVGVWVRPAWAR